MERKGGEEERERKPGKSREREREIGGRIGSEGDSVLRVKGELGLGEGSQGIGGMGTWYHFFILS